MSQIKRTIDYEKRTLHVELPKGLWDKVRKKITYETGVRVSNTQIISHLVKGYLKTSLQEIENRISEIELKYSGKLGYFSEYEIRCHNVFSPEDKKLWLRYMTLYNKTKERNK